MPLYMHYEQAVTRLAKIFRSELPIEFKNKIHVVKSKMEEGSHKLQKQRLLRELPINRHRGTEGWGGNWRNAETSFMDGPLQ